MKQLSYAEIVDATGVLNVEELENIEILFTTCEAIGSMDRCARLKRLSSKNSYEEPFYIYSLIDFFPL